VHLVLSSDAAECERQSFSAKLALEFFGNCRIGKAVRHVELIAVPAASSVSALDSTLPMKLLNFDAVVPVASCHYRS
jgi:hypothetical protein